MSGQLSTVKSQILLVNWDVDVALNASLQASDGVGQLGIILPRLFLWRHHEHNDLLVRFGDQIEHGVLSNYRSHPRQDASSDWSLLEEQSLLLGRNGRFGGKLSLDVSDWLGSLHSEWHLFA